MILKRVTAIVLLFNSLILFGSEPGILGDGKNDISYREMIEEAKITLTKLDSPMLEALIQGNGDLHSLCYAKDDQIILRLAKNDVYDARIDTKEDKELAKINIETGKASRKLDLPPSWDKPYPLSVNYANILIDYSGNQQATIDILHAEATINKGEIGIRSLLQENVYYIRTANNVELTGQPWDPIPLFQTGNREGVKWVKQVLPPDESGDWAGMTVVTAMAGKGEDHYVAVVTSLESKNPLKKAIAIARSYLRKEIKDVIQQHEKLCAQYWKASGIKLSDLNLSKVWYRNLYFSRCAQHPGSQAIGLFVGPLLQPLDGWHDNYTINYNFQQTFWSFLNTNHVEYIDPYNKVVLDYLPRARWFARYTYGVEGVFYPHNLYRHEPVNPEECLSKNHRMFAGGPWAYTLGLSGFLMHNLWLSYKYNPTQQQLQKVYPAIREMARFYASFCERCKIDADGKLVLGPTVSPEHMPFGVYNCPFDIGFMRFSFNGFLEASKKLGKDRSLARKVEKYDGLMPEYPVDEVSGFVVDRKGGKPIEYNIPVPTTPIFPAEQITFFSPEEEKILFQKTLDSIETNGNNSTIMLALAKARLSSPDAKSWLKEQIQIRNKPNGSLRLSQKRAPFNNFGHYTEMFAVSGAISELLLQSVDGIIRLFPAWPKEEDAEFCSLRTSGGFLVSAILRDCEITKFEVSSTVGGDFCFVSPWEKVQITNLKNHTVKRKTADNKGIVSMKTKSGESFILEKR